MPGGTGIMMQDGMIKKMSKVFDVTEKHVRDWDVNTVIDAWVDGLFNEDQCNEAALRKALSIVINAYESRTNTIKTQEDIIQAHEREEDDLRFSLNELEVELAEQNGMILGLKEAIRVLKS